MTPRFANDIGAVASACPSLNSGAFSRSIGTTHRPEPGLRARIFALTALLFLVPLSACMSGGAGIFELALATTPGTVDANEAALLISQYRATRGLKAVTIDPTLMKIARVHSDRMAAANKMAHVLPGEGSFMQRITAGGFQPSMAAENVAAGQKSLASVLEAWRKSPGHNANLLLPNVSKIGIALSIAPESRYKTFWTLVLGEWAPQTGAISGGPQMMMGSATGTTVEVH